MSKSAGSTRTVSTSAPPAFQQPYIDTLLSKAKSLYESPGPNFFPGSTVAPFAPAELEGQRALQSQAGQMYNFFNTDVLPGMKTAMGAVDVGNNPYLADAAEAMVRPVFQQLTEEALPALRSTAVQTGNLGGTKSDLAGAQATERTSRAALDATRQLYAQAYGQGLSSLGSTLANVPNISSAAYTPGSVLGAVGGQERAMEQSKIDEAIARYAFEQNIPYQKLAEFANLISGQYGGTGESQVLAEGGPGGTEQTIGAILAGLGIIPDLVSRIGDWFNIGGG